jgi:hypothetical protein
VKGAGTWPASAPAGLLGASYPAGSTSFVTIPELTNVQQIVASGTEACAMHTGGGVTCWGAEGVGTDGAAVVPPTTVTGLP